MYATLLSGWRSSAARSALQGGGPLSNDEMYAVSRRVKELSHGFTRGRELAGERYLSDPDLLGAYLLHFWPVSYAQAILCLEMIRRARAAGMPPSTVAAQMPRSTVAAQMPRSTVAADGAGATPGFASALDLGAGPGPVSLALLETGTARVIACDRSGAALALARKLASARGHELATRQWDAQKSTGLPRGPFDLIALGHTLNELWSGHPDRIALRVGLARKLGEELAPGGRILIMEPALMHTAQEAIRVRDGLVQSGFRVEMPCIWQEGCPALPAGTCHGEFDWRPLPEMVRLAHAARIGRETLKMAWFVLRRAGDERATEAALAAEPAQPAGPGLAAEPAPSPQSPDGGLYRVVSEPLLSKSGRVRYLVCGPMGRFALSASKQSRGKALGPFFALARGDGIRFSGTQKRETGWGLGDESSIDVVEKTPRLG